MQQRRNARTWFLFLWLLMQSGFLVLLKLGNWNNRLLLFIAFYLILFAIYGAAVYLCSAKTFDALPSISLLIFVSALLFRVSVLPCKPSLSEDFYRYLWDGKVQHAGFSPYQYAPEDAPWKYLKGPDFEKINHKEIKTPYPPFAQNVFYLLTAIGGTPIVFKLGMLLFDILLMVVLRLLLRAEGLSPSLLMLYAWHPLPVVEFAGSAHLDIIALCLLFLAYFLVLRNWRSAGGLSLAAAVMTKYLPLVALPWLVKKGKFWFLFSFVIGVLILIAQFYIVDRSMFSGLFMFYRKWRFNDSLFGILYKLCGAAEPARLLGGFFVLLCAAYCLFRRYSFYRSMLIVIGAVILFSPVVHPWYVCWVIPFLVFYPSKPWIFFSGWIALAYLIRLLYPSGVWQDTPWLKLLIYVPFYFLLIAGLINRLFQRRISTPVESNH
jgi:hypothetical protein